MSVEPTNVSFVPRERLMIFAPRSTAQRIARDVLEEDPCPLDPSARRAITLTCAVPAIHWPLSIMAAITPATPVPWYTPEGSVSVGFVSDWRKSYPWVPSTGLSHMFPVMSGWVHTTPVSTTATITVLKPRVTSQARG